MTPDPNSAIPELEPAEAATRQREGWQVVDVRTPQERDEDGLIAGSVHIELDQLPARAGELDADRPVIFYCRSGVRSALATEAWRAAGREAWNLRGGMLAWARAGLPDHE